MYVTRPLSLYRKSPESVNEPPPEGPNSGYLVLVDDETEAEGACCLGLLCRSRAGKLPFPQNKMLNVRYIQHYGASFIMLCDKAFFIPVLDQPLSSNRYYVIKADGKYKGHTGTCSRAEDMNPCCFFNCIKDVKPRPFDHMDLYQQVEITPCSCRKFTAKSVAPDGFSPLFLRRRGWEAYKSTPHHYKLDEAHGLDAQLRARLPEFNFPIGSKRSKAVTVGKWYCPFMFIKEMATLQEQMKKSMFYEMVLEQFWQEIFSSENYGNQENVVKVKAILQKESAMLFGEEAVNDDTRVENGMMWFKPVSSVGERKEEVGLSMGIVERMKWEEVRGGWDDKLQNDVNVERNEEFKGVGEWKKFGSYVLVERFVLKRMDGSLLLNFDFKHTHNIQSKWE